MTLLRASILLILVALPGFAQDFYLSEPSFGSIPNVYGFPAVAADGEGFLVVWTQQHFGIWASRLDGEGRQIGSIYPLIRSNLPSSPSIYWTGAKYLVVWSNGSFLEPTTVHITEVDRTGTVIRDVVIERLYLSGLQIAWNGTNYFLLGGPSFDSPRPDLNAAVLDAEYQIVRTLSVPVEGTRQLAVQGEQFLVASAGRSIVELRWFSGAGDWLTATQVDSSGGSIAIAPAEDGTVGVVFTPFGIDVKEMRFAVVDQNGVQSMRALPSLVPRPLWSVDLLWNGREFVALTSTGLRNGRPEDILEILAMRFDRRGELVDSHPVVLARSDSRSYLGLLARAGQQYVATFYEPGSIGNRMMAARFEVPAEIHPQPSVVISNGAIHQLDPAMAGGGDQFLAVWQERTAEWSAIYAGRISRSGERLDGAGILLDRAPGFFGAPAVVWNGSFYLVVWHVRPALLVKRILPSGAVLDESPLIIPASSGLTLEPVAVAWDGENFLFAWPQGDRIHGSIMSPSGAVQTSPPLSPVPDTGPNFFEGHQSPVLASNGRDFLLGYQRRRVLQCVGIPCPETITTEVVRVTREGIALDESGFSLPGATLRLASDGDAYLATTARRDSNWGTFLRTEGNSIAPVNTTFFGEFGWPKPIWDGSAYLLPLNYTDHAGQRWFLFRKLDRSGVLHPTIWGKMVRGYRTGVARATTGELIAFGVSSEAGAPFFHSPRASGSVVHDAEPVSFLTMRRRSAR